MVDLCAETADDVHRDRMVSTAEGKVSSVYTTKPQVGSESEFRLAWLWVEGWRAQLRKGGDTVERARWGWKVEEDLVGKSKDNQARNTVPDIVARQPGALRKSSTLNYNNRRCHEVPLPRHNEECALAGRGPRLFSIDERCVR